MRTLEDSDGLAPGGAAAQAKVIGFCWQPPASH
jgi:hypothetical protein